ncbi:MAG: metal-dependent transcriptional regulator [Anaerolineaceae bacterium]|nr:metal-dependent transcriptional regulator [Anaerolineaceae bacterium]
MRHESFNESVEMYLKTINELMIDTDTVPISALAKRLGVTSVSATEMVHKLQDQGLLEHESYKGVLLTKDGRKQALRVLRNHRLWECFLVRQLNQPWERVHDLACRMEHVLDPEVVEALAVYLNHPETCPHGNPIPTVDGEVMPANSIPLNELKPGEGGVIMSIHPESTLLLKYLAERNIKSGRYILLEDIAPLNGPFTISCDSQTYVLGREIAAHIFVAS